MLVQQAAWIGWIALAWISDDYDLSFILLMAVMAAMYWCAMGSMLTGERAGMSQRVMRRLPKSFLGRAFLSWLNPGPANGYMFVVANGTAIVAICIFGMIASDWLGGGGTWPKANELLYMLIVGWGYVVAYLGAGKMAIGLLRRVAQVNMFAGVLIHFLIVLAGSGIPTTIQLMSIDMRMLDYSYLQLTNPFWTLSHLSGNGAATEGPILILVIPGAAICILLMNLRSVVRELQAVRIAPPTRVLEDEAELHPAPEALPQNPWDEASAT
jgi:hypothetical protein